MKKIIILSLAIFWITVLSLLGSSPALTKGNGLLGAILPANNFSADNTAVAEGQTTTADNSGQVLPLGDSAGTATDQNSGQASAKPNILNAQAVAAHNTLSSCWMTIGDKVYDLTSYLPKHPAGPASMLPYCGQDGTAAFNTKDANPGKPHSNYAQGLLAPYYVGTLGQNLGSAAATANPAAKSAATPAASSPLAQASPRAPSPNATLRPAPSATPPGTSTPAPSSPSSTPAAVLTLASVASHNSATSCWMIVSNKVYDVTSYLPYHPGGINAILLYCGKDGGAAFAGLPHSQNAATLLASYYVGDLNSATPVPTAVPTPAPTPVPMPSSTPPGTSTPTPNPTPGISFTLAQVASHNSATSCWMIVSGNVYDVTSYLPRHPGGVNAILLYCGKDGGGAFVGLPHSQTATNLLASYFIGVLNNSPTSPTPTGTNIPAPTPTITPTPTPSSTPLGTSTPTPTPRWYDDDD